jgi:predicted nuclease of restriction endonuclease-like (RecB) superfamily
MKVVESGKLKEKIRDTQLGVTSSQLELFKDACTIIEQAQTVAYRAINETLIKRNWLLGLRIQHEILKGKRAEYGEEVIKMLAKDLVKRFGSGFSKANLYHFTAFYNCFPNIFYAVSRKSGAIPATTELTYTADLYEQIQTSQSICLSWTHYRILLQESDPDARRWYENEAANEIWSTRTLQRNISSQYYHRMLVSQNKSVVRDEMKKLTGHLQDKLEYLKNPLIAEFLGFKNKTEYSESSLEQSIIDHLISFLMELGKGFAFVDRQKHIHTEKQDYYLDLVFYNYYLRCFVLVDLKTTKLSYQDVGQMDMYVKIYDELVRPEGHNPTIGLLLCADTDEDVAHYSVLSSNDQLFAAKYLTYMPTKEELRREIEQQKEFFRLQCKENKDKQ